MLFRLKPETLLLLSCSLFFTQINHAEEEKILPPMTSTECLQDINFTAKFLLENDAGIRAKNWTDYPKNIQKTLDEQKLKANSVTNVKECIDITKPFLKAIRKGHIELNAISMSDYVQKISTQQKDDLVITKKLSNLTSYILIPSFGISIKDQLERIIKNNQDGILNAQYLILDLRKNAGGVDHSAEPLFKLLGEADYWTEMPQVYTSQANIHAYKELQRIYPDPKFKHELDQIIKKMEKKKDSWVYMGVEKSLDVEKITKKDVLATPKKVVVLTDEYCGSSGEEFVKSVKQNPRVVTIGRNTYGALDASNLRDTKTPSTKLSLWYATTYVNRRAGQEIDNIGIAPNIRLPKPKNQTEYDAEVKLAQHYLENRLWK
ncbi:S41 family peptidase [Acinetobacter sp. ANC 4945]|uniref:Tail specific protease domain-containing protein n=1 Tax=Acinetobacter amyesii TaxID=2942470 RepID=A0A1T1H3W3_9GAMM|nr:S41 family peptidase [Acinetobacter amyesii]MCL6247494.1 S41 family peptidase [Acinetobacter amyesii]OOV84543.1 hypothetical protein B1202_06140 [Acinetobacter amyesii]